MSSDVHLYRVREQASERVPYTLPRVRDLVSKGEGACVFGQVCRDLVSKGHHKGRGASLVEVRRGESSREKQEGPVGVCRQLGRSGFCHTGS